MLRKLLKINFLNVDYSKQFYYFISWSNKNDDSQFSISTYIYLRIQMLLRDITMMQFLARSIAFMHNTWLILYNIMKTITIITYMFFWNWVKRLLRIPSFLIGTSSKTWPLLNFGEPELQESNCPLEVLRYTKGYKNAHATCVPSFIRFTQSTIECAFECHEHHPSFDGSVSIVKEGVCSKIYIYFSLLSNL